MGSLETLLKTYSASKVIDATINYNEYVAVNLSVSNEMLSKINRGQTQHFENYIKNYVVLHNAKVAYGGYNEERNLYKRSGIFNPTEAEERNIHIGVDLWVKSGTPVLAALDGCVHSFNNNTGLGNYGPTIVLKHTVSTHEFYTLYGHLSLESISGLKIGTAFRKGEILGTLGDATVNGDYAPHLHFQIIKDLQHYFGDYPGVCSKNTLDFYLENCPDPNWLLKIQAI